VLVLATVAAFVGVVAVTRLVACGVSGCGGGGFGPTFSPREAQVGLLVAGTALAPLALYLARGCRPVFRAAVLAGAVAAGSLAAMAVLGLGPNGCPWGQSQAIAGPGAFSPGALTCSSDR
jgi:hypothetical protein